MKKSIPISDDLKAYFSDPCPVLSDNNSQMILNEIANGHDYIVEYGLGASTLYFLKEAGQKDGAFISVENNFDWFQICVQEIKAQAGFEEISSTTQPWSLVRLRAFTKGPAHEVDAPENFKRFPTWKETLETGPFYRFSPQSKSRFSGMVGPFWPIAKPVFKLLNGIRHIIKPQSTLTDAEWIGTKDNLKLILRNAAPSIKDQYGEAPNKEDYINAGLKDIKADLAAGKSVTGLFIIDGGPRHWIVQEILDLEDQNKNFKPTIILCDASRAFYHKILSQRPAGKFIAGTNKTLKGDPVEVDISGEIAQFWYNGDKAGDELSQQEVWYYAA